MARTPLICSLALATALSLSGCSRGTEDWTADLRHGSRFERQMAAIALREAPESDLELAVRELVYRVLSRDDGAVVAAAHESLVELAPRAAEELIALAEDPENQAVRSTVLKLFGEAGTAAHPALLELVQGAPDENTRALAFLVLGAQGPSDALDAALESARDDPAPKLRNLAEKTKAESSR